MHTKAFVRYILVAASCFSLMASCPSGEAFGLTHHNNAKMSNTSHGVRTHAASGHSHLPGVHETHQVDSSQQCCEASSKDPSDCTRVFVLRNKTKTFRSHLIATFSPQIAINCFQLSEKNLISEISNAINPTLVSLHTVILVV